MKKIIAAILMSAVVLSLVGCSSDRGSDSNGSKNSVVQPSNPSSKPDNKSDNQSDSKQDENKNISVSEIYTKLKAAIDEENFLPIAQMDTDYVLGYYGLDKSQLEDFSGYESEITAVNLDQIIILKCKDGYAETAVASLNKAYGRIIDYIRQYPFGVEKVLNARIFSSGNYAALIIVGANGDENSTPEQLDELAKSEYEKIDNAWKELFDNAENKAIVPEESENSGDNFFDPSIGGGEIIPDDIGGSGIMVGG